MTADPGCVDFSREESNFKKMYRVKVRLAQLGLSGAKMKTARRKLLLMLSRQQKGSDRAEPLK